MDGSYLLLGSWVVIAIIAFTLGRSSPLGEVETQCNTHHEIVLSDTVYQCKPVASMVNGKRREFLEKE